MAFFKTSRAESNEVVKAEDVTFNFDSQVSNFSVLLQSLIDPTSDFVVGGNVSVMTGMNLSIEPILGCCKDSGICFVSTEKLTDGIVVSAAESQDRIDIVQIKAIEEDYDEQQRSFIDFETKIETIQNVFTKKRVILQVEVKKGVVGSVVAPETDYGFVKLAEIFVPANTTSISDFDIYNISANYKGEENADWTNEKDKTYNFQYLSDLNAELQNEHNKDGSHKSKIIGSYELDYGVGNAQINNTLLPLGSTISVDGQTYNSTTATTTFLAALSNKISDIFNDYYNKGGKYNFNGELVLSDIFTDNALTKALKIKCDGAGFAYFYIGEKLIFTITESGKFIMPSGYNATASNEIITKTVADEINAEIESINLTIEDILTNNASNPVFVNSVYSRFSFADLDITVATTDNITLSGEQTIDGVALYSNNVVLVKNQTDATQNGIYWVNIGAWDRHSSYNTFDQIKEKFFTITNGNVNKGKVFFTAQSLCELGTDDLNFNESFYKNKETKYTVPIRDEKGNIKTGTPTTEFDATSKKYVDDLIANSIIPIGFVYTQWPLTPSPIELNMYGTWEDISSKFAGLYTRVAGGDATEFNKQIAVSSQNGTSLTFVTGHGITKGCRLIDTITGEQRDVTAVSGDTVTIDSAFSSNLTTVLIGQSAGLPNITGYIKPHGESLGTIFYGLGGAFEPTGAIEGKYGIPNINSGSFSYSQINFEASLGETKTDGTIKTENEHHVYGKSNRVATDNIAVRIWQRVS